VQAAPVQQEREHQEGAAGKAQQCHVPRAEALGGTGRRGDAVSRPGEDGEEGQERPRQASVAQQP
jgi:hypothetical protein